MESIVLLCPMHRLVAPRIGLRWLVGWCSRPRPFVGAAGTRVLGHVGGIFFFAQSPLAAAVTHVFITLLTWTPAYCDTPLVRHPLSQARMLQAASALKTISLPLVALQPVMAPVLAGTPQGGTDSLREFSCL